MNVNLVKGGTGLKFDDQLMIGEVMTAFYKYTKEKSDTISLFVSKTRNLDKPKTKAQQQEKQRPKTSGGGPNSFLVKKNDENENKNSLYDADYFKNLENARLKRQEAEKKEMEKQRWHMSKRSASILLKTYKKSDIKELIDPKNSTLYDSEAYKEKQEQLAKEKERMKKEAEKIKKEQEMRMNYIKRENKEHNHEYHQSPGKRRPKTADNKDDKINDKEDKENKPASEINKNATADDINLMIANESKENKSPKKNNIIDNL